jgi:hypothetical protein
MIGYFVGMVTMMAIIEIDKYRHRRYIEEQDRHWRAEVAKLHQNLTRV